MWMHNTAIPGGLLWAVVVSACWPHVLIVGASCPCPDGYSCCATLSTCQASGEVCPAVYPPSSDNPCVRDDDCPLSEVCVAWTWTDGTLHGPQQCRRVCPAAYPCAAAERCQLVAHDGLQLQQLDVVRACVSETPIQGCEGFGCSTCDEQQLGATFCDGHVLRGCFLALQPLCGVTCESIAVQDCSTGACEVVDTGARCKDPNGPNGNPCVDYDCNACNDRLQPDGSVCDGRQVLECPALPFPGTDCDHICEILSHACPDGWTCNETDGGAACVP